jgi:hypothetical protein
MVGIGQPDILITTLKYLRFLQVIVVGATTLMVRFCATRSNDIGVTQCADIYVGRGYHGAIYFSETINAQGNYGAFQLVTLN